RRASFLGFVTARQDNANCPSRYQRCCRWAFTRGTIRSGMDQRDLIAFRFWTRDRCLYLASILEGAAMACRYSHSRRWLVACRSSGDAM
ncbi:uncharacterized protein METZ01_LOCUS243488, partial [marine metagenome]